MIITEKEIRDNNKEMTFRIGKRGEGKRHSLYNSMTKEEMIQLLEQRNDLLREQHCLIEKEKQKNRLQRFMIVSSGNVLYLNKRASTIFWDVV